MTLRLCVAMDNAAKFHRFRDPFFASKLEPFVSVVTTPKDVRAETRARAAFAEASAAANALH
jgi:hypothetical protein